MGFFFRQVLSRSQTVNMKSAQTSLPHGGVHYISNQPALGLFGAVKRTFLWIVYHPGNQHSERPERSFSLTSNRCMTTKLRIGAGNTEALHCTAEQSTTQFSPSAATSLKRLWFNSESNGQAVCRPSLEREKDRLWILAITLNSIR